MQENMQQSVLVRSERTRSPELCLADEIPALVKRLETLKASKIYLQRQIECAYNLKKSACPEKLVLLDRKLSALGLRIIQFLACRDKSRRLGIRIR
ncbi:uncharacterized protein RB166_017660 [Leptodactylus fuscus]